MPCIVGYTSREEYRKQEWKREVEGFKDWKILIEVNTREEAQRCENYYREKYGCMGHPGGRPPNNDGGPFKVYMFSYTRRKTMRS